MHPARARLAFDELLASQLAIALVRHHNKTIAGHATRGDGRLQKRVLAALPFQLTPSQTFATAEIAADMAKPERMVRLLQGDVGSGKTLVAFLAMLTAVEAGAQAAMMAPTEVLAGQHARSVEAVLGPMGAVPFLAAPTRGDGAQASLLGSGPAPTLTYALLTAAVTGKDRARILEGIASGEVQLVLGTHALVQEGVAFADLSLAVIDDSLIRVNSIRADLGAMQNRLQSIITNIMTSRENLASANSRIRDADVAEETSELTKAQILMQAGVSVLGQANTTIKSALGLLGGGQG